MQPFLQIAENLQQELSDVLNQRTDRLCVIPSGMAWFDALPVAQVLSPERMAVVIYPSESLLKAHLFRLKMMGLREGHDMSALTSDLPPHMERHIWMRAEQQQVPLLLIPAKKMQSITTLSHLVKTPQIGPLILEEAQWVLSDLWGPQRISVYENLAILSKQQWEHRPQLLAFSRPISKRHQATLATRLEVQAWPPADLFPWLKEHAIDVIPAWSRHQKFKALLHQLNTTSTHSDITFVISHSLKALQHLEARLPLRNMLTYHHQMHPEERELCLMQLLHADNTVVLVEQRMLSEIPTPLLPAAQIRFIYWQLPWTMESLIRDLCRSSHPQTRQIETLLLVSKEDYLGQSRWLKSLASTSKTTVRLMQDHLSRVRQFYRSSHRCRLLQLERMTGSDRLSPMPCGVCDNCRTQTASSLSSFWRNLIRRISL